MIKIVHYHDTWIIKEIHKIYIAASYLPYESKGVKILKGHAEKNM